jgi:hypothetical protein
MSLNDIVIYSMFYSAAVTFVVMAIVVSELVEYLYRRG